MTLNATEVPTCGGGVADSDAETDGIEIANGVCAELFEDLGAVGGGILINDGATLTIYGDITSFSDKINIKSGGTLILYGNINSISNGILVDGGTLEIYSNVTVDGGFEIKASSAMILNGAYLTVSSGSGKLNAGSSTLELYNGSTIEIVDGASKIDNNANGTISSDNSGNSIEAQTWDGNQGDFSCASGSCSDSASSAQVIITETGGNTVTTESGTSDSFTVELGTPITLGTVRVDLSSGNTGEGTVSPSFVEFYIGNMGAKTITVTPVDDGVDDGPQFYTITTTTSTPVASTPDYNGVPTPDVGVINQNDGEFPRIDLTATTLTTSEIGSAQTFDVVIGSQPASGKVVQLDVTSGDVTEGTVSPASLTFDEFNWGTPQTVTVTPVDDTPVDGDIDYNVTLAVNTGVGNADGDYNSVPDAIVTVTNQDDEVAGFTLNTSATGSTTEGGGTTTFTVVLDDEPLSNVVLRITSLDATEGQVTPSDPLDITFTSADWFTAQTVTVEGLDDALNDGAIAYDVRVRVRDASSDDFFDPLADQTVSISNIDDEQALYGIIDGNNNIYEVGINSGLVTDLGATVSGSGPSALAYNNQDNLLYYTQKTGQRELHSFDPSDGTNASIGNTSHASEIVGLAFDQDNNLFGLDINENLLRINPTTGAVTETTALTMQGTGAENAGDLVSSPSGDMLIMTSEKMYKISKTDLDDGAPYTLTEITSKGQSVILGGTLLTEPNTGAFTIFQVSDTQSKLFYFLYEGKDLKEQKDHNTEFSGAIPALLSDLASAPRFGGKISGSVYEDTDINSMKDGGETSPSSYSGSLFLKYIVSGEATARDAIEIDPAVDGSFELDMGLLAGTYDIIIDDNKTLTDITPLVPTDGYNISESVDLKETINLPANQYGNVVVQNFGLYRDANISVTPTSGLVVNETGTTATFDVVLLQAPAASTTVTIPISSDDATEGSVSPTSLIFDDTDWGTPQTVTITGLDDALSDGDIAFNIVTDPATSLDDVYNGLDAPDVAVTNEDDEPVPGFTITETASSTNTSEGATNDTFNVVLDSQPISDVVILVSSGDLGEGSVDKASLTFSNANWDTPQTVTVTGVDDDIIDGDITYNVTLSVDDASSDNDFDPLADQTVSVTNTDDDVAGFTITETAASTGTDESATTDTFDVELDAEPGSNVVITVTSGDTGEGTVDKATLTFTPANWDTPQTVTVTGVDDDIIDGDITYNVTLSVDDASSDNDFDPLADQTVSVTNTDDDVAGFTITETAASTGTDESATTDTFDVELDAEPGSNVVITVTSGDTGEGTVDKATLTFTPANWDTPQTVTVTGVDDDIIDGDITYNVTLSVDDASSDNDFDPLADQTVSVTNTDDDVAGFTITETAASTGTDESATTDTFDVELDAEPGSNVVITVTSGDTGEGTVDKATLTFTPANWDTPQTVTVTGVDDDIIDGDITYNVTLSVDDASSDNDFDPLADQTVSVTNTDDDVAGFTITETAASTGTDESATTDTFDVELDAEPGSNVVITVTSGDTGEGTVDKATLTFTPANWDTPQTVTVTGVDDDIIDGDITYNVTLSVDDASSDNDFDPLADQTVSVTNTDDDVAGFTITETAASTGTDESATTDTFDVELDAEPGSNVVITVTSGDTGEGTVDKATLTFTPANWDTPQTVTVTGVDDDIIDGDITYNVTLSVDDASSDNDFDPLADQTVSVTNTDDDVAGFTITETAASTGTDESATTDTFDVELDAEPGSNVVITVTSGDTGEGTVDKATLTFTPANWDTPQTVTVTGVDDDIIDGDITYNVTLSVDDASSDNDFDPLADQTVSVTNTDDDVAGFTITETAASTGTDESATTDTFDVELDAEPGSNVVITVTSGDTGEGTVDKATLTFTPANWDTPQTVTVTGVDDDIIDGDITYNVTLSVDDASSDNDFDPLADQTVSVTNTDDDVAGFTITETAASTGTDESATTDTFDVELDAEPGSNVVLTVTSSDTGEGTVDLASLTFTPANWDTPQTVTVTGVDDDIIDGDITYNVTLSVDDASSDNDFDPLADQTVSVTNTDDDVAGFTITETAASTGTDESATTDTFDVELDAEPGSNVVLTVTSSDTGEGTVDLASLTFTPANWDTPQTVTVTGVDDDIIDGDITYNVTLSVDDASSDNDFDPLADQTVSVTNTDDDVAGFTITETAASTGTDESATTDTFDVELDAEPGSNVVLTVTSSDTGEGTVDLASLTFTPANWDTPQTVTVTGVDDDIIDGDITYNVTLSVDDASSDNDFDPLADQTVSVTNTDDDVAGFTITETAASTGTDESATTDTFDVELDAEPGSNVVITVTSGDTGEGTVDLASLTFTPANWDTPQTVTVTGVDDDIIDGDITYNVTLSVDDASSDNDFDPLADQTVSVTNTDDDVAGFTITETAASTGTDESATTDTFDVELDAEPGSNVVITVTSGDTGEGTVDLASLTFTPANWDTPQTVTVTGVDDDIIDGDITYNVTLSVDDASSDNDFDPLADQTVSVTNTDDDVAGFTITETAASTGTDESATTDTFDVELDAEPGSNVVITVTSSDTGEGTVDLASLTFTPANWDTPQTVTVTGVDDDIIDGDITYNVTLSVDDASSDNDFDPLADQTVSVTNTDDDVAGFTITETAASTGTDESATTDTFDVELDAEPGSNVVITVTSGDTGEGTVDLASLTFTPANWDTPQTVTVTGVDDDIIDGDITYNVTLSVDDASSDNDFDPLADQTVSVTNTDDDVAGFTITETAASTGTDESATTDTFDVELDAEPGSNVVITVTSGDTGEGTVDKATLTFTPANWDTPQTVTVTGVDDDIIDGDITYNVTLSVDDASSDNDFDPLADQTVSVTNTDDDVAGFTITETAASTGTDESATTDTFDVELDAEPGSNVVITVTSGDTGEGTVDLASLTFTPANWDTPQTVTVTGVDDDIIDGDITYNVTLSVDDASSDNDFDPLADQTVSVTNTDDDVAGFTITETAASTGTDESATTDTFDVELDAEPGSNVVITVTSGDTGEGTVDLASLTFTPANWDTPQTVTVTGVDDDIIDGDITYNVTLSVDDASSDNDFDPLADQTVSVTNTDDDVAGFTITETAASTGTDESATTDTFDVELDAEPGSNVVLTVTSGDTGEGTVDLASLTFTPANWDTPQTVTVTGVDDDIIDGDITYNVTLSVDDASSDNDFDPLADQTVSVTNTDDDVAGFTITETAASTETDESATTDTFDVELDAEPGSNVVLTVTSSDTGEGTVDLASLTFTPANWDTPQTVTVTGVDDDIIDGDITYNVTLSVDDASSDNDFDPLADQTVSVTNTDDDVAGFTITETAASTGTDESATTDTFDVELDAEPGSNVVITVTSGDTGEGTVDLASLTFTPANWDTPQTVTVTGVDDDIIDGDITYNVTLSVDDASSDNDFDPLADQTVSVTNTDDDVAGFTITETAASTGTDESATTDTFDVELDAEPGSNVVITVTSGDTGEGTVDLASLTFTPANWDTPQTVTVTGVDDDIIDGDITYNVTLSVDDASSDNDFDPLADQTVSVTNTDDDVAGFTLSKTTSAVAEGNNDTFTIVLDAQPSSDVVIDLSSDDTGAATVSPGSLTFTSANWNSAQTVTIMSLHDDDLLDETPVITVSVNASSDGVFTGLANQNVTVTVTDDDIASISISAISGNTREDGTTATFTIVLDSEPTADVTIGLSSDNTAEGTVSPSSVTFTTANWNIAQTVTVTGVDDAIDDGDVVYTIVTAAATSSDTNYNGLDPADVTVTNEDNDGVGISVSAISGNTTEDGTTATFTIVLDSEPTADVTIGLSSDNTTEGTVSPSSVTFTTANWNVAQTVNVTGVDDNDVDGDVTYTIITSAAASSDANYNGLDPTNVVVINEDNDSIDGTPVISGQVSINSIDEDTDFTISLTDLMVTDSDNDYPTDHTLILLSGSAYAISGSIIIPQVDYNGALKVNLKVSDGVNESNVYEYEVDIRPVNDKPILVADALTVQFGNTLEGNLLTNDSDVENDDLVLTDISPLPDGMIFNTDGSFIYNGDTEIGTIAMDYVVCDNGDPSECAQSTFTLIIEGGDFDGDGIPDSYEIQFEDVDDDGLPTYNDLDSDADGIDDAIEAGFDSKNPVDTDQDGMPDFVDLDSDSDGKLDSEEGTGDCDKDNILNYIDSDDLCRMKIADAFSPNGDGKNDEWIIQGIENYPENKVTIFNRWGNKIFEIDGYDNNSRVWRGEINTNSGSDKNASYSTYYFIIDLKDGSKPIAGNILLSR